MERIPFKTPGGHPLIATVGEVFSEYEVYLMVMASAELNLTVEVPRYRIVYDRANCFAANGTRLPANTFTVKVEGSWVEDGDLGPLVDRMEELRAEASS